MYRKEQYRTDIILIEDSRQDTFLMKECLDRMGLNNRVTRFATATEAHDWLFRQGQYTERELVPYPLFVMIDVRIPIMDGVQLLRAIRSHDKTNLLPVVMFTDSQGIESIHECYDSGANAYIVKPMQPEEFEETLSSTISFWTELNRTPYRDSKFLL